MNTTKTFYRASRERRTSILIFITVLVLSASAGAQDKRFGGHIGFVIPLATEVDGETTTVDDDFVIGFPMGLGVKLSERVTFDLELVPVVQDTPQEINLVIHPGAIFAVGSFAVGVRAAFETDSDAWGFTPLIAKGWPVQGSPVNYFVELDFPIRFRTDNETAIGIAFHSGISF